ncbi:hypothetical protein [Haloarcula amylovorans]|uniref:hypothetical protein n=1 Tax=Haloarcula amylovorans TaxID=2562280 RepID=UPI001075E102|nr:hypothetical protein [Halomicroarcula amylolytica]
MESLLGLVVGFILLLTLMNWKLAVFFTIPTLLLVYFVGASITLTIVSSFIGLLVFFKLPTTLLLGSVLLLLSWLIGLEAALGIVAVLLLGLLIILTIAFISFRDSYYVGLRDTGTIVLGGILRVFSNLINRIELIGTLSSPNELIEAVFSHYPGTKFAEERRDDFVKRGTEYVHEGLVDVDKSAKELAQDTRGGV